MDNNWRGEDWGIENNMTLQLEITKQNKGEDVEKSTNNVPLTGVFLIVSSMCIFYMSTKICTHILGSACVDIEAYTKAQNMIAKNTIGTPLQSPSKPPGISLATVAKNILKKGFLEESLLKLLQSDYDNLNKSFSEELQRNENLCKKQQQTEAKLEEMRNKYIDTLEHSRNIKKENNILREKLEIADSVNGDRI